MEPAVAVPLDGVAAAFEPEADGEKPQEQQEGRRGRWVALSPSIHSPQHCKRCVPRRPWPHGTHAGTRDPRREQPAASLARRTRHRWGPIPGSDKPPEANGTGAEAANGSAAAEAAPAKRRRRSRWAEDAPEAGAAANGGADNSRALMLFPGEIVLSNGIKVVMPPALTGRHASGEQANAAQP